MKENLHKRVIKTSTVHTAVREGRLDELQHLIQQGADVNKKCKVQLIMRFNKCCCHPRY